MLGRSLCVLGLACVATVATASTPCPMHVEQIPFDSAPVTYAQSVMWFGDWPIILFKADAPNAASLHVYTCLDRECRNGTLQWVSNSVNTPAPPRMVLRSDGSLAILDGFAGGLRLYGCGSLFCSRMIVPIDSGGIDAYTMAVLPDGRTAILYRERRDNGRRFDLILHLCNDLHCTSGTESVLWDQPAFGNRVFRDVVLGSTQTGGVTAAYLTHHGNPTVASYDVAHCADSGCSVPSHEVVSGPTAKSYPTRVFMEISWDRPILLDAQAGRRVLIECEGPTCADPDVHDLPPVAFGEAAGLDRMSDSSLAIGLSEPGRLGLLQCADGAACIDSQVTTLDVPTQQFLVPDLTTGTSGAAALTYVDAETGRLHVATCMRDTLFASEFEEGT